MKLCDLAIWPAQWLESSGPGDASSAEDGVLEGLTRLGGRLFLRINLNGHRRTACLELEPPPAVGDVESVLLAHIGAKVRELGHLDLPSGLPTP